MYPGMTGKEDTGSGSDEPTETSDDTGTDDSSHDDPTESPGTESLEEIQDELREKERELEDVRDELESKLHEKESDIDDLREELDERLSENERRLDDLREEINTRRRPAGAPHSDRHPKAAGALLGVTGFLGLAASVGTGAVYLSPDFTFPFIEAVGRDPFLASVIATLILSGLFIAGGWSSYKKQGWYFAVFAAIVAAVFVTPLGLPALVLIAFAEPVFE